MRRVRPGRCGSIATLLLLAPAATAFAQFDAAAVLGVTRDGSGAAVAHTEVVLTNVTTGVSRTLTSDAQGSFDFESLPIGDYKLTGDAPGFQHTESPRFSLTVGARQKLDLTLGIGSATTIEVSAAPTLLETETSSHSLVVATTQVENLPLNGRSYADLSLLAPGVRRSVLESQSDTSREASFNVNGQRSAFNNFLLDGLDNNNYGTSNQGFENENIAPSPDAVSEFRIETDNYSAEYGRNPGAVVNVSLRSGSNNFHGRAWDYNRNTALNAIGPFLPAGGNAKFIRNQFGGTFGGPIWKDRTFFFVDYEGMREIFDNAQTTSVLPTANERAGLFYLNDNAANAAGAIPLKNPITGKAYLGQIPTADMTPFAQAVLAALPTNTSAGLANNFAYTPRGIVNDDKGDVRVDHTFNQRLSGFARYSQHAGFVFDPPGIPGRAGGNSNGNTKIDNQDAALGVTWAIRPNQLLDARVGWSHNIGSKFPIGYGDTSIETQVGITDGLPAAATRDLNTQAITGFTQLGAQNSNPQFQNPTIFNPKLNYTLIHHRNSLKFGYELQLVHTELNDFNPSYGADTYAGQFSANGNPASTAITSGNSSLTTQLQQAQNLADFYFGNRSAYSITNYAVVDLRQRYNFFYVQDDVKLSDKLTVNAGLRYEIVTPQWEKNNRLANFNPATVSLVQASNGSLEDKTQVDINYDNLAPRFGFSYQSAPNTVLRGGYAIVDTEWNRAGGENNLTYNGPNVVNASITQSTAQPLCTSDAQLQSTCFRQTQQGYSNVLTSPANFNPLIATSRYIPKHSPTGYVQEYFLGVQQQAGKYLFDLSYVGNKSTHLQTLADYNQATNCVATATAPCASYANRRPITTFGQIEIAEGIGPANYNSLQFRIERRANRGLYLLNSFTWSRTFDISDGHLETGAGDTSRVDFLHPNASYGPSAYDQPLTDVLSLVYDLPYGHGRQWGNGASRLMQTALGGWQVTLINTMSSGQTENIIYSLSSSSGLYTSSFLDYRVNRVPGQAVFNPKSARVKTNTALTNVFNPAAFTLPTTYGMGNLSRNAFRSNPYFDADLGLHKQFPLWNEHSFFDLRGEAFNVLNKVNYGPPTTTENSSTFGAITTAYPARQLQIAGKIIF